MLKHILKVLCTDYVGPYIIWIVVSTETPFTSHQLLCSIPIFKTNVAPGEAWNGLLWSSYLNGTESRLCEVRWRTFSRRKNSCACIAGSVTPKVPRHCFLSRLCFGRGLLAHRNVNRRWEQFLYLWEDEILKTSQKWLHLHLFIIDNQWFRRQLLPLFEGY